MVVFVLQWTGKDCVDIKLELSLNVLSLPPIPTLFTGNTSIWICKNLKKRGITLECFGHATQNICHRDHM